MQNYLQRQQAVHRQRHWLPRILVAVSGFVILLTGLAMLVLPGPAIVVIPIGLGLLSLEFAWARYLLEHSWQLAAWFNGHRRLVLAAMVILALLALSVVVALLIR